ncbi:hypothetical protein H2199_008627 [Coniosporium tulheliwenetii]|uniref:Uncharacterized protein n=1 Tax=Coniosporium tulheliwenetii TaxID=3383036 RepID=A0ACC2YIK3_9PEZI|nr:hypothetical protein H2199_008627 [Cladosporium sp. JES 115]
MPLTILSDADVQELLLSLNRQDILNLQQSLADALHHYSTATDTQDNGCCPAYQPQRTSLRRKDGSTTLFMPASSNDGLGIKVVTLTTPDDTGSAGSPSMPSVDSLSISSSSAASTSASSSTTAPHRQQDQRSIRLNTKLSRNHHPRGSLTLFDSTGSPRALINAEEITAFRTALASTILFRKRHNVHELSVFGAGKQAYWHIRLAVLLRGAEIHHLNVINRSFSRAHALLDSIWPLDVPSDTWGIPKPKTYDRLLKEKLRASSAIFTTTPSLKPLFPREILTSTEGRKKGRYIAAIGSYKPHMLELDPEILRQAVHQPDHKHHHHRHAKSGGAVVVDSVEACLKEAGEVIQAGLEGHQVVELGELVMLKRDMEARRRGSSSTEGSAEGVMVKEEQGDTGLRDWLERGM